MISDRRVVSRINRRTADHQIRTNESEMSRAWAKMVSINFSGHQKSSREMCFDFLESDIRFLEGMSWVFELGNQSLKGKILS